MKLPAFCFLGQAFCALPIYRHVIDRADNVLWLAAGALFLHTWAFSLAWLADEIRARINRDALATFEHNRR